MSARPNDCGLSRALKVIGGKWKVDILCALHVAPRRFGRLRQLIPGISEKMLMQHLREMEADGIISRKVFPEMPAKVVYSLTELGRTLNESVADLCDWGELLVSRKETSSAETAALS